jgi:hypothetical protein
MTDKTTDNPARFDNAKGWLDNPAKLNAESLPGASN